MSPDDLVAQFVSFASEKLLFAGKVIGRAASQTPAADDTTTFTNAQRLAGRTRETVSPRFDLAATCCGSQPSTYTMSSKFGRRTDPFTGRIAEDLRFHG